MQEMEIIKKIEILFENKIILYGAASYGKKMLELLRDIGCDVIAFCDSNTKKWGTLYEGIEVVSKQKVKEIIEVEKVIMVVSSIHFSEIVRQLEIEKFKMRNIYSALAVQLSIFYNIDNKCISEEKRKKYKMFFEIRKEYNNDDIIVYMKKNLFEKIKKLYDKDAIMIYQVGKVASQSIHQSLENIGVPAIHLHSLQGYIYETRQYQDFFDQVVKSRTIKKIITLVREPIERDISAFFQRAIQVERGYLKKNLQKDFESMYCDYLLENKSYQGVVYQGKHKDILERCREYKKYGYTFDWFDCEINKIFNINILEYPFDKERGYSIIQKDNIQILVMKMEKLNQLQHIIGEFVGNDNFKLEEKNKAKDKEYTYLYKEFLNEIKLKRDYINFYYHNNKAMEHFYSMEEQKKFMKKWEKNIIDDYEG